MILEFDKMPADTFPHFKGGEGALTARSYADEHNRILHATLAPGSSIGWHVHDTSSEIIYILSGEGKLLEQQGESRLSAGMCHYCPKGCGHSILNDGEEDLVLFAVVPQQ